MLTKIKKIKKKINLYKQIIFDTKTFKVSLFNQIRMYLNGFTSDQYILYGFDKNNMKDYITEIERYETKELNGQYNFIMDNKLVFEQLFAPYVKVPKNYFWISNKKLFKMSTEPSNLSVTELLKQKKKLFLKPVQGTGGGKGIHLLSFDEYFYWNKEKVTAELLEKRVLSHQNYTLTEYAEQHEYANKLYPETTNTIRLVTILNDETQSIEIPIAVQRIGVQESIPVDNANRGGLVSMIDVETGALYEAKSYKNENIYTTHPDSGANIKGEVIPNWDYLKQSIVKVAEQFPYIKFVAWDILVTPNGFVIIEMNKSTAFRLFQLWEGQKNKSLGQFYKKHSIIK